MHTVFLFFLRGGGGWLHDYYMPKGCIHPNSHLLNLHFILVGVLSYQGPVLQAVSQFILFSLLSIWANLKGICVLRFWWLRPGTHRRLCRTILQYCKPRGWVFLLINIVLSLTWTHEQFCCATVALESRIERFGPEHTGDVQSPAKLQGGGVPQLPLLSIFYEE